MKKVDLLHTTVLIIALIAGFEALQNLFLLLGALFYTSTYFRPVPDILTDYSIQVLLYAATAFILIRNAPKIARGVLKDDPEGSWEDAPKWDLDRRNILLALFVGMGLYTLIQAVPNALTGLYQTFVQKISNDNAVRPGNQMDRLALNLLKVTTGAFIIFAAPNLAKFIEKLCIKVK